MYEQRIQKQGMVSLKKKKKKAPPEVLEHLKAAKIKYINFSIADYFGIVKEAYYVSKNIIT